MCDFYLIMGWAGVLVVWIFFDLMTNCRNSICRLKVEFKDKTGPILKFECNFYVRVYII